MKLHWTKEKPRADGYYWVRRKGTPAEIRKFEWWKWEGRERQLEPIDGPWSIEGWEEFAGPIPAPTGHKASDKPPGRRHSASRRFQACNRAKKGAFPFS